MSRYAYDPGSSMRVFVFGGFFGFVCSWAMRNHANTIHPTYIKYSSSKFNSILALIGTVFCFVLFPLISQQRNFTNVEIPIYNFMKFACTINVVFAMTSSIITSTLVSLFFDLKIGIKDFIFASIAGGIAIGASSDLITNLAGTLVIGIIAGIVQVLWNRLLDKYINQISIIDSLSSLGLFGIAGVQGGIWSAIYAGVQGNDSLKSIFLDN
jgi:ammonium transporter Rh